MYEQQYGTDIRIISVTSVAGATTLKELVNAAVAAKSAPANVLPPGTILQIAMTPSANITVSDVLTGDGLTHALNVRQFYPVKDTLEKLKIAGIATVLVELYFGR